MSDYERIARVIRYLDEHRLEQPSLDDLAREVGLSRHHFHRLFVRWAGITPKSFLQCLTLAHAKARLLGGDDVLGAALAAGLSGPGRLHDLSVKLEAASPGELRSGGAGWTLVLGFANSPFGTCRIAESPRGICDLAFVDAADRATAEAEVCAAWPAAELRWDTDRAAALAAEVFRPDAVGRPLRALVAGSRFQVQVWRALLSVPRGALVSYGQLAGAIGRPGAARAVGTAVGKNNIAYLIPCHRVIRETGVTGDYRWGPLRKRALLAWESGANAGRPRSVCEDAS